MNPFDVAGRLTAAGRATVRGALSAPDQVAALWGEVNDLVRRATRLLNRADLITARLENKLDELDSLSDQAPVVREQLSQLQRLMELYTPVLESLAPLGREAVDIVRPAHLRGLATLLAELPNLVDRIEPALEGMGSMVPRLDSVTDRMDTVGQVVEGLPGAKLLKRRGQAREDELEEDR